MCSPIPVVVAISALSLLSDIVVLSKPGLDVVARDVERLHPPGNLHGVTLVLAIILFKTILLLLGVLGWAVVLSFCLYLATGVSSFLDVLTICCYAAYAREAVRFIVSVASLAYSAFSQQPLKIVTNLAAVLSKSTTPVSLYYLASFFDVLELWFLILVVIGLWKGVAGLRLGKATLIVLTPTLILLGLGFWARHY
jgi:hypothetical protein